MMLTSSLLFVTCVTGVDQVGTQQRWMTFLRNHSDGTVTMDFLTVPTVHLCVLYWLFIIEHARQGAVY